MIEPVKARRDLIVRRCCLDIERSVTVRRIAGKHRRLGRFKLD